MCSNDYVQTVLESKLKNTVEFVKKSLEDSGHLPPNSKVQMRKKPKRQMPEVPVVKATRKFLAMAEQALDHNSPEKDYPGYDPSSGFQQHRTGSQGLTFQGLTFQGRRCFRGP